MFGWLACIYRWPGFGSNGVGTLLISVRYLYDIHGTICTTTGGLGRRYNNHQRLHQNFLASASLASCCQRQCRLCVIQIQAYTLLSRNPSCKQRTRNGHQPKTATSSTVQSHFKDNGGLYAPHNHLSRPMTQQPDFLAMRRATSAAQQYDGGAESNKQEMNLEKSDIFMREA